MNIMKRLCLVLPLLFVLGCSFGFEVGPGPVHASSSSAVARPGHHVLGSAYPSNLAGDVTGAPGANVVNSLSGSTGTITATASTLSFSQASTVKTTAGALAASGASELDLQVNGATFLKLQTSIAEPSGDQGTNLGASGDRFFQFWSSRIATDGTNVVLGSTPATIDSGGGSGVLSVAATSTAPTSNPSTSGDAVVWSDSTLGLQARSSDGVVYTVAPDDTDTGGGSQTKHLPCHVVTYRTSDNSAHVAYSWATTSNTAETVYASVTVRQGTSPTQVFSERFMWGDINAAGTLSIGTAATMGPSTVGTGICGTSGVPANPLVTAAVSSGTFQIDFQCGGNLAPTIDWQAVVCREVN